MRASATAQRIRAQLRVRVLAGVVSVVLFALVAFDVAAVLSYRHYLVGQTDDSLRSVLVTMRQRLSALLSTGHTQAVPAAPGVPPALLHSVLGQYDVIYLSRAGGRVVLESGLGSGAGALPRATVTKVLPGTAATVSGAGAEYRMASVTVAGGSLVAGTGFGQIDGAVGRLQLLVVLGSVAALLLIGLGVFVLLRRGLHPIEAMAAQADRITAGDLADRVGPDDGASEVGRLGAALNGMLGRIETSPQEREAGQRLMRRFFADASHELRTPLASLRANAELYQQGALTERAQVDEVMRRIALETRRMSGLVDDMLRLARLDQHPGRRRDPVDVSALVHSCVDRARVAAPGHTWRAEIAAGLTATGDEDELRGAVDNLLGNVRAHTPAGTVATVTAARSGDAVTIEVGDDGPGVAADQLPRVFDRFYRAGAPSSHPASRPGSGLGLSIVREILAAHDGSATAALNPPRGMRVTLALPTR